MRKRENRNIVNISSIKTYDDFGVGKSSFLWNFDDFICTMRNNEEQMVVRILLTLYLKIKYLL